MSMTASTLAMMAVGEARHGYAIDVEYLTPASVDITVTDETRARTLTVNTTVSGFHTLNDGRRQVTLPEAKAVRTLAAWIDGAKLPVKNEKAKNDE